MQESLVSSAVAPRDKEDLLGEISTGMRVYDLAGKMVGHVDAAYGGARGTDRPAAVGVVAAGPVPASVKVPATEGEFDGDDGLPREIRERLEHDGFIRIDAGFFRHHRYALRDQI